MSFPRKRESNFFQVPIVKLDARFRGHDKSYWERLAGGHGSKKGPYRRAISSLAVWMERTKPIGSAIAGVVTESTPVPSILTVP